MLILPQVSMYGMCGGQSDSKIGFPLSLPFHHLSSTIDIGAIGWGTSSQDGKGGSIGFDSRFGPSKSLSAQSLCPHSVALEYTRLLTEMSTKEFPWG